MFEKLSRNLSFLMSKARISASQLAKNTGVPATTIKRIRQNSNVNPTLVSLLPICKFFNVSLSQLVGENDISANKTNGVSLENENLWFQIPIFSWSEAIFWKEKKESKIFSYVTTDRKIGSKGYALIVEEAYWENFTQGTLLLVEPELEPEHGDYVIVYKGSAEGRKEVTLKQILFDEDEKYLKPMVAGYKVTQFTDQHKLLGVVMEYKKILKK